MHMGRTAAGSQHVAWSQDLLAQVLQQVPQQQRLTSCALVCRSWRTVAVAATTSLNVPRSNDISTPAINSWLIQHGSNLHSLTIARHKDDDSWANFEEPAVLLLPFHHLRQLRHLDLQQLVVQQYQAGGEQQHHNSWADLAMLTSLRLHQVNLQTQGTYAALSAITTLQNLQITCPLTSGGAGNYFGSQYIRIQLAPLSQLTRLAVDNLPEESMSALSKLRLSELRLVCPPSKPSIFQHLPMTLETLEMSGFSSGGLSPGERLIVSASSTPRLMELTSLQHLRLTGYMNLEPSLLSTLVKLTHLDMSHVDLVPDQSLEGNIGTGLRAFLGILPCFVELRHLRLLGTLGWRAHQHGDHQIEPEAFASLLSSTCLTCLDISKCDLPGSVVRYMFQGQQTALNVLRIHLDTDETQPINTQDDLQLVVQCCPSLRELCLVRATNRDVRLTMLGQLSDLTSLTLGGRCMQSAHTIEDILSSGLQLTLKQLTLRSIPNLAPMKLLCLRQLTKLTRLNFSSCEYMNEEIGHIKLCSKADPSDVWQQFEEACLRNGIGAEVLLQERIAGSQRTIASLQQQLREEQQLRVACEQRASQMQQLLEQQAQHLRQQRDESRLSNSTLPQQLRQSHQQPEVAQF